MNCTTCKHAHDNAQQLQCRRYPPQPTFPAVDAATWCGEYIGKPVELVPAPQAKARK